MDMWLLSHLTLAKSPQRELQTEKPDFGDFARVRFELIQLIHPGIGFVRATFTHCHSGLATPTFGVLQPNILLCPN